MFGVRVHGWPLSARRWVPAFATLLAAVPADASAADAPTVPASRELVVAAGTVNGYRVSVAARRSGHARAAVVVRLTRRVGVSVSAHEYGLADPGLGASLSLPRSLRSGRLRGDYGRFGSIDLRMTATGAAKPVKPALPGFVPSPFAEDGRPSCTGRPGMRRVVRVTGTLDLKLRDGFFRALRLTRFGAASIAAIPDRTCTFGADDTRGIRISGGDMTVIERPDGTVDQRVFELEWLKAPGEKTVPTPFPAPLVQTQHTITATGLSSSTFTHTGISAATVTGGGAFLSGTATFAARPRDQYTPANTTLGALMGDLTFRWAHRERPFLTGAEAMLSDGPPDLPPGVGLPPPG